MNNSFDLIITVVNRGFADKVMDVARSAGAKGGTVLQGRGTAAPDAEQLLGIVIQPEKEVVLIVAAHDIKNDIMNAIMTNVGLADPGQGIVFTMPVNDFCK